MKHKQGRQRRHEGPRALLHLLCLTPPSSQLAASETPVPQAQTRGGRDANPHGPRWVQPCLALSPEPANVDCSGATGRPQGKWGSAGKCPGPGHLTQLDSTAGGCQGAVGEAQRAGRRSSTALGSCSPHAHAGATPRLVAPARGSAVSSLHRGHGQGASVIWKMQGIGLDYC